MIKSMLVLLLASAASAGTVGNSCTPKTVFDAGGNCTIFNETVSIVSSGNGISAGTIDTAKLNSTIQAQLSMSGTANAGSIDTAKIAADAVTGPKILNGTIDTAKLNATIQGQLSAVAGKQASFSGLALGPCGASQYIGSATTVNGVITAGSCTADASGAAGNTQSISSQTFSQPTGQVALYVASGNIVSTNFSTATLFNITVTSTIALNTPQPSVFNSSGVIGYWMINQSSRAIQAGELVQDSSGTVLSPQGVIATIAAATTTIMGVALMNPQGGISTPINGWVFVATSGMVTVWCGVANACSKGRTLIAAGGAAGTIGRGTGIAAPAAGSDIGVWMVDTPINTRGWVRLEK